MRASTLRTIQAIVTMVATIAVPVVLGVVGWQVQASIARQTVQKDFVQMALGIITKPPAKGDERLRQWAVEVLDKNAPVPFTKALREELIHGASIKDGKIVGVRLVSQILDTDMMKHKPLPWIVPPGHENSGPTVEDLVENYAANHLRAENNRVTLEALQGLIRDTAEVEAKHIVEPDELDAVRRAAGGGEEAGKHAPQTATDNK